MKFTFEGSFAAFHAATMEEIVLRQARKHAKERRLVFLCAALMALFGVSCFFRREVSEPLRSCIFFVLMGVSLAVAQLYSEKKGGKTGSALQRIRSAYATQSEEDRARIYTYTFEGDTCTVRSGNVEVSVWDCRNITRAVESDDIFALSRRDSALHRTVIPVPKKCLKGAAVEEFRAYLSERVGGSVPYFRIPDNYKKYLK